MLLILTAKTERFIMKMNSVSVFSDLFFFNSKEFANSVTIKYLITIVLLFSVRIRINNVSSINKLYF